MTDEELLAKVSAARGAAHRAPFAEWSKDHRGHSSVVNHTSAWAARGDEFMALADDVARRGLKLPPCDCPPGAHVDWAQLASDATNKFPKTLQYLADNEDTGDVGNVGT